MIPAGHVYTQTLYAIACVSLSRNVNQILEIGAGPDGVSGTAFAEAMRDVGYSNPHLISIDINPAHPSEERRAYVTGELRIPWEIIVGDSLTVRMPATAIPIDLLYIDGDHGGDHAVGDYERFACLVRAGGLIVFDDYFAYGGSWSGANAAVEKLTFRHGGRAPGIALPYDSETGNAHYVIQV